MAVWQFGIFQQEAPSFMEECAFILIKSENQLAFLDKHQVAPPLMGVFQLTVWLCGGLAVWPLLVPKSGSLVVQESRNSDVQLIVNYGFRIKDWGR